MVKKSGTFIFKELTKLQEMLLLRRSGWTFVALSDLYDCDRTSLRYQCRKYQIFPQKSIFVKNSSEVFNPERIAKNIIIEFLPKETSNWIVIDGEKINTGRNYKDYFRK